MVKSLLLFSLLLPVAASAGFEFKKLKDNRVNIQFDPLTTEEKTILLKEAQVLFGKFYVNYERKKQIWGADPLPALEAVEKNLAGMNEEQFHSSMLDIFSSVHDFHVNYNLPRPYSCHSVVLPLSLFPIENGTIVVKKTMSDKKDLAPEIERVSVGDELIAYNGKNPLEFIKERSSIVGATSPGSVFMQGIYDLYYRGLSGSILPAEDEIKLTFKKNESKETYTVTLPWLDRANVDCLKSNVTVENLSGMSGTKIEEIRERTKFVNSIPTPEYKKTINKEAILINSFDLSDLKETKNQELKWKVFNQGTKQYGYMALGSFQPASTMANTINEIKDILENEMKNTKGLVIDLRGNYGGQIAFAEKLAALLSPNPVRALPFYIRANEMTSEVFNENSMWKSIIAAQITTNKIVGPANLTTAWELSEVSQAYFGKVALLTNSECFSSCDLFAAIMKDYAKVKIYGTDKSTFGGGANVWDTSYVANALSKFGYPKELPQNMSMRITSRHARRFATNNLIEDVGVETDTIVSNKISDILFPGRTTLLGKIFSDFDKNSDQRTSSETRLESQKLFIKHSNETFRLTAKASGMDTVELYKNKNYLQRLPVSYDGTVSFDLPNTTMGFDLIELFGRKNDALVLRRPVWVETLGAVKKDSELDLINDAMLVNFPRRQNCGWMKKENTLVIADKYCSSLTAEAVYSLDMTSTTKFSFDLKMDSEKSFDVLTVTAIVNGEEKVLSAEKSGSVEEHVEVDLKEFSGLQIDLKIKFIADEEVNGTGISISNLKLE